MPLFDASHDVRLCLFCLMAGILVALPGWAEETSQAGAAPVPESTTGMDAPLTPAAPPKKTEYDKLPLAQLAERAKANDAKAQFELGSRFNYGRGLPKNIKEALRWLRRAAQNGQQDAQRLLALKFFNGYEVPTDLEEAFKWTQQLAEAGDATAQLALGNMYASGEGTQRNLVRAYMWYDIAAAAVKQDDATEKAGAVPESQAEAAASESEVAAKTEAAAIVKKIAQQAAGARDNVVGLLLPDQEVEAQQLSSDWWLRQLGVSLEEKKPVVSSKASSKRKQH